MNIYTIFIIILAGLIVWVIFAYNRFIRFMNRTKEAWSDIDVQLKRRYNLIPNLVETVKGYASHEKTSVRKRNKGQKPGHVRRWCCRQSKSRERAVWCT